MSDGADSPRLQAAAAEDADLYDIEDFEDDGDEDNDSDAGGEHEQSGLYEADFGDDGDAIVGGDANGDTNADHSDNGDEAGENQAEAQAETEALENANSGGVEAFQEASDIAVGAADIAMDRDDTGAVAGKHASFIFDDDTHAPEHHIPADGDGDAANADEEYEDEAFENSIAEKADETSELQQQTSEEPTQHGSPDDQPVETNKPLKEETAHAADTMVHSKEAFASRIEGNARAPQSQSSEEPIERQPSNNQEDSEDTSHQNQVSEQSEKSSAPDSQGRIAESETEPTQSVQRDNDASRQPSVQHQTAKPSHKPTAHQQQAAAMQPSSSTKPAALKEAATPSATRNPSVPGTTKSKELLNQRQSNASNRRQETSKPVPTQRRPQTNQRAVGSAAQKPNQQPPLSQQQQQQQQQTLPQQQRPRPMTDDRALEKKKTVKAGSRDQQRPHTLDGASRQHSQREHFPSGSRSCASTGSISDAAFNEWCERKAREQRERKEKQAQQDERLRQQMLEIQQKKRQKLASRQSTTKKQRPEGLHHPKLDYVLAEIAFSPYRVRPGDPYRQTQVKFLQKVRRMHYSGERHESEMSPPKPVSPMLSMASHTTQPDDAATQMSKSVHLDEKSQHSASNKQLPRLLVKKCRDDVNEVLQYRPNFDHAHAKRISVPLRVQMQAAMTRPKSSGSVTRMQALDWGDDNGDPAQADRFTAIKMHPDEEILPAHSPTVSFNLSNQDDATNGEHEGNEAARSALQEHNDDEEEAAQEDTYSDEKFDQSETAKHEHDSHHKRMQSIVPTVDSSTPASFLFAQQNAPAKKSMLREERSRNIQKLNTALARRLISIADGADRTRQAEPVSPRKSSRRWRQRQAQLEHANKQQALHLKNVKPYYTKESLTPRFCAGNKQGKVSSANRKQRKLEGALAKQAPRWSDAAKALAKTEDGQDNQIFAEIHKVTNNTQILICVYKEPESDAFTIHSVDANTGQQNKLTLTSDQVHLIVEETFPLVDLHSQHVWRAVLDKYKLYELSDWDAIQCETKPRLPKPVSPQRPDSSAPSRPKSSNARRRTPMLDTANGTRGSLSSLVFTERLQVENKECQVLVIRSGNAFRVEVGTDDGSFNGAHLALSSENIDQLEKQLQQSSLQTTFWPELLKHIKFNSQDGTITLKGINLTTDDQTEAAEAASTNAPNIRARRHALTGDDHAAALIQAAIRGHKARRWKFKLATAATKIQANFRMRRQREAANRQLDAVVTIQASFRGRRTRSISHAPNSPTAQELTAAFWEPPKAANLPDDSSCSSASTE